MTEVTAGRPPTLDELRARREEILGCQVDLVTEKGLRERIKPRAVGEALAL